MSAFLALMSRGAFRSKIMSRKQEPSRVYLAGEHVIDAAPTAREEFSAIKAELTRELWPSSFVRVEFEYSEDGGASWIQIGASEEGVPRRGGAAPPCGFSQYEVRIDPDTGKLEMVPKPWLGIGRVRIVAREPVQTAVVVELVEP